MLKPTMSTLKLLPVPVRLPFFGMDVPTTRASLTGISRWNKHNEYASYCGFVVHKQPELIKRPVVRSTPLSLRARLLVEAVSDSGQVLKSQCSLSYESLLYQLFADVMVEPLLKATFSAREPSEQPSRVASAFALNVRSDSAKSVPGRLNLFATPGLTCRSGGDVTASEIDSNYFGRFARWWGINLNYKVDVVITLVRLLQRCTSKVLSSQQCNLVATNRQVKVNSSTLQCHTHSLRGLHIFESANVQANRGGSELVDLLNGFGVVNYPADSLTNVIGFKTRSFSHWLINLVVKLGGIPTVVTFGYCKYLVASISKSPQSLIDLWSILYRDYKLALHRQGLSHGAIVTHPVSRRLKSQPAFLSALKWRSFPHWRFT